MLISFAWLKTLVRAPDDVSEVARRLTARGLTVDAVTRTTNDTVFDIDVPANRPDALGHLGVAREVAAAFGLRLVAYPDSPAAAGAPVAGQVAVTIDDPALCGRYTAGIVRGVRVGPSPDWVASRLTACGLRPINNVVDASNLVMMELGQPVHFFDLARLRGAGITVRGARANERITTLDGVSRTLAAGMIVIADTASPIAIGGVMGGADTQIREETRDILVEAAWFTPAAVRMTSRALGLSTDASQRFERGCDPEAPAAAQALAARLLVDLAGGSPAPGLVDVRPSPAKVRTLTLRPARAQWLLGFPVADSDAMRALDELGLSPRSAGLTIEVTVPSWRVDLEREADLVEEVGRHLGYDLIPAKVPSEAPRQGASTVAIEREERIRDRFAALGFNEAVNYAMIGPAEDESFVPAGTPSPLALLNPISESLSFLRRTLLPGLLRAADQNLRRGADRVLLFEIGGVFNALGKGHFPEQPTRAAFAAAGMAEPAHWSRTPRALDAWDAAGWIEDILVLSAGDRPFRKDRCDLAAFHPGQALSWSDENGRRVAWCGRLHPDLAERLDLHAPLWLGEVDLALALGVESPGPLYSEIPRFPATWRDLSIVIDSGVASGGVINALRSVVAPAPVSMSWLDRYSGPPLGTDQSAMTLRVMLQPLDRTLTDAEAEAYRADLVAALDSVPGVRLRRIDT